MAQMTVATVFQEKWWLLAAATGQDEIEQVEVALAGQPAGSLCFVRRKKYGLTMLTAPPHTRILGPWVAHSTQPEINRVVRDLVAELPSHHQFYQVLPPHSEGIAMAFALCGFNIQTQFTTRIPCADLGVTWNNINGQVKKRISGRQNNLRLERHADVERFIQMARQEYSQEMTHYDFAAISRIFTAAHAHDQGIILSAHNGIEAACAIVVWDHHSLYFWLATRNHANAGRGAKSFLVWHAIKLANAKGLTFDFDTYGSTAGGTYTSRFGGIPTIRPVVTAVSPLVAIGLTVKPFVDRLRIFSMIRKSRGKAAV